MKKPPARKLEIFLLLALRQAARREQTFDLSALEESEAPSEFDDAGNEQIFSVFAEQLNAPEAEKFERLRLNYRNKADEEKLKWRERVEAAMRGTKGNDGEDDFLIDENIHRSHVEALLARERPAIQKIVAFTLPPPHRNLYAASEEIFEKDSLQTASPVAKRLANTVREAFAAQFVALKNLPDASAFDRLSGAQLARLVRLAGMREVAYACAGIKAVEAVAGFLRRFAPEDARAIAAQLSSLPKISDERLAFAENLVQSALEIESQPSSAMLDRLGVRLVGILLCAPETGSNARLAYAEQKLPLETEPKLSAIVETECRTTPDALKRKIASEIERLAETVVGADGKTV